MNSRSSAKSTISSKRSLDLALGQAEHDAVDEDVLAAGDLGMKAGAELDQRGDAAVDAHRAARRLGDAGDELQRGALARSVAADDAVGRSLRHRERHVGERRERLARLQVAQDAALQQRALERRELPAAVAAVDLRDVGRARSRGVTTASANESRSRSKQPVAGEEQRRSTRRRAPAATSSGRPARGRTGSPDTRRRGA